MPKVTWFTGKPKPLPVAEEFRHTSLNPDTFSTHGILASPTEGGAGLTILEAEIDGVFKPPIGKIVTVLIAVGALIFNLNLFIAIFSIVFFQHTYIQILIANRLRMKKIA